MEAVGTQTSVESPSAFTGDALFCQLLFSLMFLCQQPTLQQMRNLTRKREDADSLPATDFTAFITPNDRDLASRSYVQPPHGSSPGGTIAFPNEPVGSLEVTKNHHLGLWEDATAPFLGVCVCVCVC